MNTATAPDGTLITYERDGTGDALVLVGGAFSYRRYPGQVRLAKLLAARFTVYSYDRRGRGDSGDTAPYAVEREIEDLAAVIEAAGGHAHVWGLSSGAVLALKAAAAGVPIRWLAMQEPPLVVDPADRRPPADLSQHVSELIGVGERGEAVRYFMVDGMGAPSFVPGLLHLIPGAWRRLTAVAHTLPYDAQLLDGYQAGHPPATPQANKWESTITERVVGPASYFPSIEKKYGRPISDWLEIIGSSGLTKHKVLVEGQEERGDCNFNGSGSLPVVTVCDLIRGGCGGAAG